MEVVAESWLLAGLALLWKSRSAVVISRGMAEGRDKVIGDFGQGRGSGATCKADGRTLSTRDT
jgi:hypothetical protein